MSSCNIFLTTVLILIISLRGYSQEFAKVTGNIKDQNNKPLDMVTVAIIGTTTGTSSIEDGSYSLKIPANQNVTIRYSFVGFKSKQFLINIKPDSVLNKDIVLQEIVTEYDVVDVKAERTAESEITIDIKPFEYAPSAQEPLKFLIFLGGRPSSTLSSAYSVRGGNYDENLIYVNDIEIYRPFLIRSGKQEGLSFINSEMVSSVKFSTGGFTAKYGDKLSSALDIKYKKPTEFGGAISMGLQGGNINFEGCSKNHRIKYLIGGRYKSNQYVLNSLDTKGDYKPSFADVQSYITYDITEKLEVSFLGNYANNKYNFIPEDRETKFGTLEEALQFKVYFDGSELDQFETYFGAVSFNYLNSGEKDLNLKLISSAFKTYESETFDIIGQYWLNELDNNADSETFGEASFNRGVGTFMQHARNNLEALVYNFNHKGSLHSSKSDLYWGIKYQREEIIDELSEWNLIDSAGYSIPKSPDDVGYSDPSQRPSQIIELQNVRKANIDLSSNRVMGYVQNSWEFSSDSVGYLLTAGIRSNYWDFNSENVISPRVSFAMIPNWEKDMLFRFSTGYYYQPPFYKELRDLKGQINYDIKAQKSIHFVLGNDYEFKLWNRPFKLISEIFYKHMDNLIPYEVENVRIKYFAENSAKGYAAGIDFKINGEFVKGMESWASLTIMDTKEDIKDDFYYDKEGERHEPGYIPRPTDQRVNFSLYFQDYLPKNPSYKMHLSLLYGSRMRYGPPDNERYKDTLKIPPYRRVDIGFSKIIKGKENVKKPKSVLNKFKSIWISLEVFNLLQINNTISYLWISDIYNRQVSVPNYLTNRQLNLRLTAKF